MKRLLPLLAMLLLTTRCASDDGPFGPDQARALIPEAAGMEPERAYVISALGAAVTWEDMSSGGNAPLSVVLLALGAAPYADPDRDAACAAHFRSPMLGTNATPTDFLEAAGSERGARHVSLLRAEFLKEVTCEVQGEEAHGEVSFVCNATPRGEGETGILYEGRVEWTARLTGTGWRIEGFRLPGCGVRIRLTNGKWVARDDRRPADLFAPRPGEVREVPSADLVRAATMEALPSSEGQIWAIGIRADGRTWAKGPVRSVSSIESFVGFAARRKRRGSWLSDLVLRVHPDAPWSLASCVLGFMTDRGAHRVFFAVRGDNGDHEGVLPCLLPTREPQDAKDASVDHADLLVRLAPHAKTVDPDRVRTALERGLAATGEPRAEIRVVRGVAAGHVIRIVDLLRRAGAKRIVLPGLARSEYERALAERLSIERYVAANPVTAPGASIWIGGETLVGDR